MVFCWDLGNNNLGSRKRVVIAVEGSKENNFLVRRNGVHHIFSGKIIENCGKY